MRHVVRNGLACVDTAVSQSVTSQSLWQSAHYIPESSVGVNRI